MAQYVVLHTLKTSTEEFVRFFTGVAPEFARKTAAGETPAKCLKTWNPIPHGRSDYVFCLWEADNPEDIKISLGEVLDYVTFAPWQVDEIDWELMAKAVAIPMATS